MNSVVHVVFLVFLFLLLSHVQVFVNPWTATHQAPLSSTVPWSLLKFMPIESMMLCAHVYLGVGFLGHKIQYQLQEKTG